MSRLNTNIQYLHRGSAAGQTTEPVGGAQVRMSVFPCEEPISASIMFCYSKRHSAS